MVASQKILPARLGPDGCLARGRCQLSGLTGHHFHEELVFMQLLPWWMRKADAVHRVLTEWIPTAPSELSGDALMDAALKEIRTKLTGWPNHGETDRSWLAIVADPARLQQKIRCKQADGGYRIDWGEDMNAIEAHPAFRPPITEALTAVENRDSDGSENCGGGGVSQGGKTVSYTHLTLPTILRV